MRRNTNKRPTGSLPDPTRAIIPASTREQSARHEERVLIGALGMELTPGSGSTSDPSKKGDGANRLFWGEAKERTSGFSLTADFLRECCVHATNAGGKHPVAVITLTDLVGYPRDWAVVPLELFKILHDIYLDSVKQPNNPDPIGG